MLCAFNPLPCRNDNGGFVVGSLISRWRGGWQQYVFRRWRGGWSMSFVVGAVGGGMSFVVGAVGGIGPDGYRLETQYQVQFNYGRQS